MLNSKLPKCVKAKDGYTGMIRKFCPMPSKDHGELKIMESSREGDKFFSNTKEVMERSRDLKLKSKDHTKIGKLALKTFRVSKKIEKQREIGGGFKGISGLFKRKDSSEV